MRVGCQVKQDFDLSSFPLDAHDVMFQFEPATIHITALRQQIDCKDRKGQSFTHSMSNLIDVVTKQRKMACFSSSTAPKLIYPFSNQPIRIKTLKSYELQICSVSQMAMYSNRYPYMSPAAAEFRDFFFDTTLTIQTTDIHDLLTITAKCYRKSTSFVMQNLFPVVLIGVMGATFRLVLVFLNAKLVGRFLCELDPIGRYRGQTSVSCLLCCIGGRYA